MHFANHKWPSIYGCAWHPFQNKTKNKKQKPEINIKKYIGINMFKKIDADQGSDIWSANITHCTNSDTDFIKYDDASFFDAGFFCFVFVCVCFVFFLFACIGFYVCVLSFFRNFATKILQRKKREKDGSHCWLVSLPQQK